MAIGTVLKLAAPLATGVALAIHGLFGSAFAAEPIGLTNVSGAAATCSQPAPTSVCATLFQHSDNLYPGKAPEVARTTIGFHGATTSGSFGIYLSRFESKSPASSSLCTAGDPAAKLNLTITQGAGIVYEGNLSDFAANHHDPTSLLHLRGGHNGAGAPDRWRNGDSSDFTIAVGLDRSADNSHMGCMSSSDIAWSAA